MDTRRRNLPAPCRPSPLDAIDSLEDVTHSLKAQSALLSALALSGDGETEAIIAIARMADTCLSSLENVRALVEQAHKRARQQETAPICKRPVVIDAATSQAAGSANHWPQRTLAYEAIAF